MIICSDLIKQFLSLNIRLYILFQNLERNMHIAVINDIGILRG